MRPLTADDEAALRAIAERHGFYAARGPHTGEGSANRLIDALLAGEAVTLALSLADHPLEKKGVCERQAQSPTAALAHEPIYASGEWFYR